MFQLSLDVQPPPWLVVENRVHLLFGRNALYGSEVCDRKVLLGSLCCVGCVVLKVFVWVGWVIIVM